MNVSIVIVDDIVYYERSVNNKLMSLHYTVQFHV